MRFGVAVYTAWTRTKFFFMCHALAELTGPKDDTHRSWCSRRRWHGGSHEPFTAPVTKLEPGYRLQWRTGPDA